MVNHGVSVKFMDEVFAQSRRLFSLPLSEKMKLLRNKNYRGYTPSLDEHLDHENQVHGLFISLRNALSGCFCFIGILGLCSCFVKIGSCSLSRRLQGGVLYRS